MLRGICVQKVRNMVGQQYPNIVTVRPVYVASCVRLVITVHLGQNCILMVLILLNSVLMEHIIQKQVLLSKMIVFHAWQVTCVIGVLVP